MAKNAVPSYEQQFFVNGTGLSGIRDISAGYSVPEERIDALGAGFVRNIYAGPLQGSMSFARDILYDDPILRFTGESPLSGTLIYDTELDGGGEKVLGFNTGYLTDYSVNCGVGDVPTVDCSFVSFGRFGSGIREGDLDCSGQAPYSAVNFQKEYFAFANQGSIECGLNQSGTNRVVQAAQSYTIQRDPIYDLSQKTASDLTGGAGFVPTEVLTNYPIEVRTNFTVEVDDFETANIMDTIRSGHYETIQLKINKSTNGIQSLKDNVGDALKDHVPEDLLDNGRRTLYNFRSVTGQLISENISTSIDGVLSVNLEFVDFLNKEL
jgi:hypothetical protein